MIDQLPAVVQFLTWAAVLFAVAGIAISGVMLAAGRQVPATAPAGRRPARTGRDGSRQPR